MKYKSNLAQIECQKLCLGIQRTTESDNVNVRDLKKLLMSLKSEVKYLRKGRKEVKILIEQLEYDLEKPVIEPTKIREKSVASQKALKEPTNDKMSRTDKAYFEGSTPPLQRNVFARAVHKVKKLMGHAKTYTIKSSEQTQPDPDKNRPKPD